MTAKLEDGIWEFEYEDGDVRLYYIKAGMFSQDRNREGDLLGARPLSELWWKLLRRIATLDGNPVVDEGAKRDGGEEALPLALEEAQRRNLCRICGKDGTKFTPPNSLVLNYGKEFAHKYCLDGAEATAECDRLQARVAELGAAATNVAPVQLCKGNETGELYTFFVKASSKGNRTGIRNSDGRFTCATPESFAANFTPLADEQPIVDLRKFGAFPCWRGDEEYTAWDCSRNSESNLVKSVVRRSDGWTDLFGQEAFDRYFTRTPPITLPPEQEQLVEPLAAWANRKPEEAREFLKGHGVRA